MNKTRLPHRKMARGLLLAVSFSFFSAHSVVFADTRYGPVQPGETLSSIVNENYLVSPFPDHVIMREIFRMNPGAFIHNNMGLMRQGTSLTLPSDQTIAEAVAIFAPQVTQAPVSRVQTQSQSPSSRNTQRLEEKLASVRAERDRLNSELRQLKKEARRLKSRASLADSEKAKLSRELSISEASLELSQAKLQKLEQRSTVANTSEMSVTTKADISRKDKRIKDLETAIASLYDEHEKEIQDLKKALDKQSLASLVEQSPDPDASAKIKALTSQVSDFEFRIGKLIEHNESLGDELNQVQQAYDELVEQQSPSAPQSPSALTGEATGSTDGVENINTDASAIVTDADGTSMPHGFSAQLAKPVTFPLWGALLGAGALLLTTLLMFLARGRAQKALAVTESSAVSDQAEEELVFRSANLDQYADPDVEMLRVPPRRDSSRVAILDPSMTESAPPESPVLAASQPAKQEQQGFEVDLKLAMAEAYDELGDQQAANELLQEVRQEGNQKQLASAEILLNRLAS